jgi:hypothetical protein
MIFRTRPDGHRPRFCSSVTSTPSFSQSTIVRRDLRCLSHRRMRGLVLNSAPRTVSLSSRWTLLSPFRCSTASMRPLCGVRTLPTLLLLPSRHRIGSPFRSSACVNPSKISSRPLRSRAVLNSFARVRSSALSLLLRTRFYAQRWRT